MSLKQAKKLVELTGYSGLQMGANDGPRRGLRRFFLAVVDKGGFYYETELLTTADGATKPEMAKMLRALARELER